MPKKLHDTPQFTATTPRLGARGRRVLGAWLCVTLSVAALPSTAYASPPAAQAPAEVTWGSGGQYFAQDPLNIFDTGMGAINDTMQGVDTTIAMLQKALDIAQYVPVIGAIAQILRPVVNTYLDIRQTVTPLLESANRGRAWVAEAINAKDTLGRIFSGQGNLDGALADINGLVGKIGGLTGLPQSDRVIDPNNARRDVGKIVTATNQEVSRIDTLLKQAQAEGNVTDVRFLTQRRMELTRLSDRLRQAGEMVAARRDSRALAERTNRSAKAVADKTGQYANQMVGISSEVGATKLLSTIALDTMNATASGFDTLSQQLTILSEQQTISNEQSAQLLEHFEEQNRQGMIQQKRALEARAERIEENRRSMVQKSRLLGDSIRQTMQPSSERRSDVRSLMRGEVR